MGLWHAVAVGVLPFLPGDALKVVIAGLAAPSIVRSIRGTVSRRRA